MNILKRFKQISTQPVKPVEPQTDTAFGITIDWKQNQMMTSSTRLGTELGKF